MTTTEIQSKARQRSKMNVIRRLMVRAGITKEVQAISEGAEGSGMVILTELFNKRDVVRINGDARGNKPEHPQTSEHS